MIESKYSYKNIWKIAYPIILGSLAQDLITIIDTIFIGRLGEVALGAAAIGGILYLAIVMIGWGFGVGIQIIIARRYGEGKIADINKTLFHAFFTLLFLALLVFVFIRHFSPSLLKHILSSDAIAKEAQGFIHIRIFGIFAAFTNILFRSFYIGTGNTKAISTATIIMALINIVLDYFLIFGHGIISPMEIKGAAIASVIAEYTALLYFIYYTKRSKLLNQFKLFRFEKWEFKRFNAMLKVATPTMLQNFISFASWFVFFIFVEKMGETPLAISNIIRSIYIILLLPILGFSSATNTLVSYAIGKNESHQVKPIIIRSMLMACIGIAIITGASAISPEYIIGLFSKSPQIINETLPVYSVVTQASFALAFGMILFQSVSGTGNTKSALSIEFAIISIYLGSIYWMVNNSDQNIAQIWKMEFVYGIGLGILSLLYLRFGQWKNKSI